MIPFRLFAAVARPRLCGIVLTALVGGCVSAPPSAPHVWTGQLTDGGPGYRVGVRSWQDMKFINMVRQRSDFSCGAAALATILNHAYGKNVREEEILIDMLALSDAELVREKGFSLLDLKRYVQSIGMTGEGYTVEAETLRHLKVPAIVLLDLKGYKHFVVVRLVEGDVVHVADPALGNRHMKMAEFEAAWNDVVFVVLGEGYVEDTVLRRPSPPLSAQALFGMRAPVQSVEVYDFGLGPAFNFTL